MSVVSRPVSTDSIARLRRRRSSDSSSQHSFRGDGAVPDRRFEHALAQLVDEVNLRTQLLSTPGGEMCSKTVVAQNLEDILAEIKEGVLEEHHL